MLLCILCFSGCGKEKEVADFSGITSVCELATLKCYYHNVAKTETKASGIFGKWLKTGYKKIWTEYDGIIEYGVDINKVTVSEPSKNGVVTITIPDAQVLSVDVDEDSISTPLTDKGFLTSISTEEKVETLIRHKVIWRKKLKKIMRRLCGLKKEQRLCWKNT